jgi:serine/threonine protein kinase
MRLPGHWLEHIRPGFGVERSWGFPAVWSSAIAGSPIDSGSAATAAYMSPEQAEGKPLDARSDIFSFGAALYEMAAGRRAFQGDSKAATMAAVLSQEPKPLTEVASGVPHELACLA